MVKFHGKGFAWIFKREWDIYLINVSIVYIHFNNTTTEDGDECPRMSLGCWLLVIIASFSVRLAFMLGGKVTAMREIAPSQPIPLTSEV